MMAGLTFKKILFLLLILLILVLLVWRFHQQEETEAPPGPAKEDTTRAPVYEDNVDDKKASSTEAAWPKVSPTREAAPPEKPSQAQTVQSLLAALSEDRTISDPEGLMTPQEKALFEQHAAKLHAKANLGMTIIITSQIASDDPDRFASELSEQLDALTRQDASGWLLNLLIVDADNPLVIFKTSRAATYFLDENFLEELRPPAMAYVLKKLAPVQTQTPQPGK